MRRAISKYGTTLATFNPLNPGSCYSGTISIQLQALRVQRVNGCTERLLNTALKDCSLSKFQLIIYTTSIGQSSHKVSFLFILKPTVAKIFNLLEKVSTLINIVKMTSKNIFRQALSNPQLHYPYLTFYCIQQNSSKCSCLNWSMLTLSSPEKRKCHRLKQQEERHLPKLLYKQAAKMAQTQSHRTGIAWNSKRAQSLMQYLTRIVHLCDFLTKITCL